MEQRSACHNSSVSEREGKYICDVCAHECEVVMAEDTTNTASESTETAQDAVQEQTAGDVTAPTSTDAAGEGAAQEGGEVTPAQDGGNATGEEEQAAA